MKLPVIVTNFKTYESATGEKALWLAKIHEKIARSTGASIAIAVQIPDIHRISQTVSIPVFSQHVDAVSYGAHTGFILPESVKANGAFGTLLNHSEHRVDSELIGKAIERAKAAGLFVIVCAQEPVEGHRLMSCKPDLVAVEPPELIGGDISVSTARPEIISGAVELIGRERVLVGAGVKNAHDVRIALKLGASGVLLASGITKSLDPESVLQDLVSGLQ